ncbi:MAG TPA: hypothetical protein VG838_04735 [Opitutaceae bacterium]|nr:hypothetical protein [Opitutaceae bacterium]
MLRRFSLVLTLAAWLLATGSQWDLAQTFAWGRMLVTYSRTMTLEQALQKTFDGEMCAICAAVQDARQQQDPAGVPAPDGKPLGKILFVSAPGAPWVASPVLRCAGLASAQSTPSSAERGAPPSPPPRALA